MVGHTGNFEATVRACEVLDECIGKVIRTAIDQKTTVIITADHGNAEQMLDEKGGIHTAHTSNRVPLIVVDDQYKAQKLRPGTAIDVAPTILAILDIELPGEMTGRPLFIEN